MRVTAGVFEILRVPALVGRTFAEADDAPGSPETVVLAYRYWTQRFGGDADVVGKTIQIEGRPREIIGVMPSHLRFLRYDPAFYLPFQFDRSKLFFADFSCQGLARLRSGATIAEANSDMARMIPLAIEEFPMPGGLTAEMMEEARFGPNVIPLKEDVVGDVGNVLWVLLGTVGLVLLIACANVTNLFLVRAEGAQREVAMRTALGAGFGRIAWQSLAESLVLGTLGGLAGLGLAQAGIRVLRYLAPADLPRLEEISIDGTVLGVTLGLTVFAALLFGLVPVLQYGNAQLVSALKEGGHGSGHGRARHRLRNLLAVSQVAFALVLLIGSGLMIRSFRALRDVHPGFERPEEVLTLRLSIPEAEIEEDIAAVRAHEEILDRLSQLPGVTSVGAASSVTMEGWQSNNPVFVEEFPVPNNQLPPIRRFKSVAGGYFSTMGIPILAGRAIDWSDIHERRQVVMITENLAREYWDDPFEAIGKRVRDTTKTPWREIVGVVGNVRDDGVSQEATKAIYWPMVVEDIWEEDLSVERSWAYVIRTSRSNPESLLPEVRSSVWSVNPNLPLANVRVPSRSILDRSMARTSFTLVMLGIATTVAILLGAVGIYGVISYTVSQRTREIGVRMALGARNADVSRMVLQQGGIVAAIGIATGLAAAIGLTRLMSALLYGVTAADPMTFLLAAVGVGVISLLASYVPARRAANVDPVEALHWE